MMLGGNGIKPVDAIAILPPPVFASYPALPTKILVVAVALGPKKKKLDTPWVAILPIDSFRDISTNRRIKDHIVPGRRTKYEEGDYPPAYPSITQIHLNPSLFLIAPYTKSRFT